MKSGPPPPWSYTRNQRYGLLLLLTVIGLVYVLSTYLRSTQPTNTYDNDALLTAAELLRSSAPVSATPRTTPPPEGFPFDPNTVSAGDLRRLGLSARQAASFIKFRGGGRFSRPEELRKLYVLRPEQADHLIEYARIAARETAAGEVIAPAAPPETFAFDPNTVSADSFARLGFTDREAAILLKYRSYRPLTFRKPEDVLRVTAIDQDRLRELLPVMEIVLPAADSTTERTVAGVVPPSPVDINSATAEEWQQLPGIGPYRARKIVEYRDRLGGFVSIDQVATTYGLPDSSFQQIAGLLRASTPVPSLYVNRMTAEELGRHPYLRRRTAEIIVRYRQNHGAFASADELKKVRALSTETLEQLLPYLNFDP